MLIMDVLMVFWFLILDVFVVINIIVLVFKLFGNILINDLFMESLLRVRVFVLLL